MVARSNRAGGATLSQLEGTLSTARLCCWQTDSNRHIGRPEQPTSSPLFREALPEQISYPLLLNELPPEMVFIPVHYPDRLQQPLIVKVLPGRAHTQLCKLAESESFAG